MPPKKKLPQKPTGKPRSKPGPSKSIPARSSTKGAQAARARSAGWRQQQQRQQRNRRLGFIGLWSTLGVVAVLVVVLVFVQRAGSKSDTKNIDAAAPATLTTALATVPATVFDQVGAAGYGTTVAGLKPISGTADLTDSKPTLIYVGGEFCPYCAAQRWVPVTTLDRFGSFTGLQTTKSAADDGNYSTLTFAHATYTSSYVAFDGKEIYDRARNKLQTLSAAASASYSKFGQVGSVPYFSVNNAYTGTYQYDPQELGTLSAAAIAAQIKTGTTTLAKNVVAAANILTASLCKETGDKPAAVCSSSGVTAGAAGLVGVTPSSGAPSSGSTP